MLGEKRQKDATVEAFIKGGLGAIKKQYQEIEEEIEVDVGTIEVDESKMTLEDFPVPARPCFNSLVEPIDPDNVIPLQYYDNDDGFWDDWIEEKMQRYNEQPLIIGRKFFRH